MRVDELQRVPFSSSDKPHKKCHNFLYEHRMDEMSILLES